MALIFWRQLIDECKKHISLKSKIEECKKKEVILEEKFAYMERVLNFINDNRFQEVLNDYMGSTFEMREFDIKRFRLDYAAQQYALKGLQTTKAQLQNEELKTYSNILYNLLSQVMMYDSEEQCKQFYCPTELVTSENLPILKYIKEFACYWASEMYRGIGGCVKGESVIANLAQKIEAFEKA